MGATPKYFINSSGFI